MKLGLIGILLFSVLFISACITINTPTVTVTSPGSGTTAPSPTATTPPSTTTTPPPLTTPPPTFKPTFTPTLPPTFENKVWHLALMGDKASPSPVIPGKDVNIKFDKSSHSVSGSSGCNTYNGKYFISSPNIMTITDVLSTMMYCAMPAGIMAQENQFLDLLKHAERYEAEANKLTILCAGNKVLVFHP